MAKYLAGITHKQFGSGNGGYSYLAASVIASAVSGWQKDKFDVFGWIENESSDKWFDYLGMDKRYFKQKLEGIEDVGGSGIVRREYR